MSVEPCGSNEIITLVSGFGGVLIGGAITYFSERHFRINEKRQQIRNDFQIVMAELSRTTEDLYSIYLYLTGDMPKTQPELIFGHTRMFVSVSVQPAQVGTEKIFSVSHEKQSLFNEVTLAFRRFNSLISSLNGVNEQRALFQNVYDKKAQYSGIKDVVGLNLGNGDSETAIALVRLENLYRGFFPFLISSIKSNIELVARVNELSKEKFGGKKEPHPEIAFKLEFKPIAYLEKIDFFEISKFKEAPP